MRVPSASEDRPRWAMLAGIAVACVAIGIGLARWGTYSRRGAETEVVGMTVPEPDEGSESARDAAPEAAVAPEPAPEPTLAAAP
ncbi:MAG: hypothetical protein M3Y87_21920, partial [Myxococcota bacterium]|nr:hypothetical protein [Myxococcota bacterium]